MKSLCLSILACIGALALVCPHVRADEWNKKTIFTFSQPVEVPGRVLPAGTYVFKLADSMADRHIVQVFNKRENHLYGTFLAIPDYRMKTPDKTILTFEERAANAPEAVKEWFYPGDNYGNEFVYPKARAAELAYNNNQSVPPMPSEANTTESAETMNEAPAVAQPPASVEQPSSQEEQPSQEENIAQAYPPENPSANRSANEETEENRPPARLPKTASPLPLIGLIGLASLGAGWSLRIVASRVA